MTNSSPHRLSLFTRQKRALLASADDALQRIEAARSLAAEVGELETWAELYTKAFIVKLKISSHALYYPKPSPPEA